MNSIENFDRINALKFQFLDITSDNYLLVKKICQYLNTYDHISYTDIKSIMINYINHFPLENITNNDINNIIQNLSNPTFNNFNFYNNYTNFYDSVTAYNPPAAATSTQTTPIYTYSYSINIPINNPTNQDDIPIVLKKESLDNIPIHKFSELSLDQKKANPKCMIKLEDFNEDDLTRTLKCKHVFRKNEIDNWLLNTSHKCPICRKSAGESMQKFESFINLEIK